MAQPRLYAGTSGFAYPSWKPDFYPKEVPQARFLEHYASRLNAVEINYTFRQNPNEKTVTNWVASTPEGFRFCVKAHQRITHMQRLKNAASATEFFLKCLEPLRINRRLGVVLFQLPPNMKANPDTLAEFLEILPSDLQFAFEFRNDSWFSDETYSLLKAHNCCLCLAESDRLETPPVVTADFSYYRLRKADYSQEERDEIQQKVGQDLAGGRNVYLFFKHEETADGALYAEELIRRAV